MFRILRRWHTWGPPLLAITLLAAPLLGCGKAPTTKPAGKPAPAPGPEPGKDTKPKPPEPERG